MKLGKVERGHDGARRLRQEIIPRCHRQPGTFELLHVLRRHLQALVRLDRREEPAEQLPTERALYVRVGDDGGRSGRRQRRHTLVEAHHNVIVFAVAEAF